MKRWNDDLAHVFKARFGWPDFDWHAFAKGERAWNFLAGTFSGMETES